MAVVKNDVFDNIANVNNQIDRNNFDLSEAVNLTTNLGRITPIYTRLMPPNSSMKINVRMALKMMPFAYDLQNRINARISFFKVPLRTLWVDYEDFVSNFRKDLQPPYIDFKNDESAFRRLSVSSLADYLGVPPATSAYITGYLGNNIYLNHVFKVNNIGKASFESFTYPLNITLTNENKHYLFNAPPAITPVAFMRDNKLYLRAKIDNPGEYKPARSFALYSKLPDGDVDILHIFVIKESESIVELPVPDKLKSAFQYVDSAYVLKKDYSFLVGWSYNDKYSGTQIFPTNQGLVGHKLFVLNKSLPVNPFHSSSGADTGSRTPIKLSAYPFRAYEAIYNSYYRDMRNNPFYVDGKVQYNRWLPSRDGGADKFEYDLHQANWERDFLTTAQFTPQQGDPNRPPLVGITTYETMKTNEDGSYTVQTHAAITDEDGKKYGLEFTNDEDGLTDVKYTRLSDNLSVQGVRSLYDVATSGISISDLRNVNAYQKFLEMNMRKGYSYKDIIEGRFDVKVKYDALLMPEFLGSMYQPWETMAITQMVDQTSDGSGDYSKVLGSQAGLAQAVGRSEEISVFCDEECLIMGLLVVSPSPVYSQLLPKHFLHRDLLDSFNPEFNHLGFQPIYNKEVSPYGSFVSGNGDEVFGYQRPWYEYVSSYDTCKGLYRTQLSSFLMQRNFIGVPQLGQDFLLINPEDVNDVFTVTDISDKIFGQIAFDISAKLPIARLSVPRLD